MDWQIARSTRYQSDWTTPPSRQQDSIRVDYFPYCLWRSVAFALICNYWYDAFLSPLRRAFSDIDYEVLLLLSPQSIILRSSPATASLLKIDQRQIVANPRLLAQPQFLSRRDCRSRCFFSRAPANCTPYAIINFSRPKAPETPVPANLLSHLAVAGAVPLPLPLPLPHSLITRQPPIFWFLVPDAPGSACCLCLLLAWSWYLGRACLSFRADLALSAIRLAPPAVHCQYRNRTGHPPLIPS